MVRPCVEGRFAGTDVQPQVQARFNTPVDAVGLQELGRREPGGGAGSQQLLGVDRGGGTFATVRAAG
jgi:hypothetical protein